MSVADNDCDKPIQSEQIQQAIPDDVKCFLFTEIDSTNTYLKLLDENIKKAVCIAESQTAGRGRFGRTWISPKGKNIYCSIQYPISDPHLLAGLSAHIAYIIAEVIKKNIGPFEVALKWPNDIYVDGKKIAGILIELLSTNHKLSKAIIGFGINVNMTLAPLDNSWTSLTLLTGRTFERAALLTDILKALFVSLDNAEYTNPKQWQTLDMLYNKKICVRLNDKKLCGIAKGINQDGSLNLLTSKGTIIAINSGEASLHDESNDGAF